MTVMIIIIITCKLMNIIFQKLSPFILTSSGEVVFFVIIKLQSERCTVILSVDIKYSMSYVIRDVI